MRADLTPPTAKSSGGGEHLTIQGGCLYQLWLPWVPSVHHHPEDCPPRVTFDHELQSTSNYSLGIVPAAQQEPGDSEGEARTLSLEGAEVKISRTLELCDKGLFNSVFLFLFFPPQYCFILPMKNKDSERILGFA